MRYINTIDDTIQFIDVDNTITNVPVNGVYTFIKGDTISFILLRRLDNEGYCVMTTRASDVEINGTVYSIDDYIDGTATQDLYTATGLRFEVVEELPDEGQSGVIYLVPNEDDTYDEYIWLEDEERFERVGNTDVDLSDYYTKEEVDTALATKQNTLTFDSAPTQNSTNPVTSGGVYTALSNIDLSVDTLESEVEENGRVTASALVDLDEKIDDLQSDLDSNYYTETEVDNLLDNYYDKDEIDEGNRVVSTALNRLNNDVVELQSDLDTNYYTESEVDTALATKQNTLTFDSAPTQNSTNPVTSGGLYIVLGDIDTALATIIGSNS